MTFVSRKHAMSGMTLVELMVSIGILSIVMTGMSLFFVNIWRTNSFILESGSTSLSASRSIGDIVDFIRNARTGADGSFPIVEANETEFTFFVDEDQDGDAERVHIYFDTGVTPKAIKYGITEPTTGTPPSYPSGDETVVTVATYVVNETSEPIFTYYDGANTVLDAEPTLSTIRMVNISVRANMNPSTNPNDLEFSSFVSLRNLWGK